MTRPADPESARLEGRSRTARTAKLPDDLVGTILLTVPHMDDCVLGCGGLLALLPDASRVHVCYATDGARSPAPVVPWRDRVPDGLPETRRSEARAAMACLGVPAENVHFLDLPDGRLRRRMTELRAGLAGLIAAVRPDHVLVPFRFDRHPDHIALNSAVISVTRGDRAIPQVFEYFVYHRSRLLPAGDIRAYIRPDQMTVVDIGAVAGRKRAALERFESQTTRFFHWQTRPNLTPQLLDEVSRAPETFLRYDAALPGTAVFGGSARWWILIAHRLEPLIKRYKDRAVALARRAFGG